MHNEQRRQTHALLTQHGLSHALFADFFSVKWLTGFDPPVQVGPNFFAAAPPLVWYEDGLFTLITLDTHAPYAGRYDQEPDGALLTYQGYSLEHPLDPTQHLQATLTTLFARAPINAAATVGLEEAGVTVRLLRLLQQHFTNWLTIDGWLEPLRLVKTAEELTKLRANFALAGLGQSIARQSVAIGQREIDVWTAVHSAIQQQAGRRVPLGNDCIVNYRSENIGGWPLDHVLHPGDSLIVDLSTQLHGYWSDSCGTYYPAEPTPQQRAIHQTAQNALDFAISLIRPGAVAGDIDQKVRQFMSDAGYPVYPHHTGHGVGASGHEAPRLVPGSDHILEAGMVIMLEPGIYLPGEAAVRLEDALLVTADGAELLTHFDKTLPT
jgi:Xaa-Pro aminopeptidase